MADKQKPVGAYEGMLQEAKAAGSMTEIIANHRKLEEGETVTGRLLSFEKLESATHGKEFTLFTFETDAGVVTFTGGVTLARLIANSESIGSVFHVVHKGMEALGGGKKMNTYTVHQLA